MSLKVTYGTRDKYVIATLEAPDAFLAEIYEAYSSQSQWGVGSGLYRIKGLRVSPPGDMPRLLGVTVELLSWNCDCE